MPTRDTFTMGFVPIPQVVFPGIVSTITFRPRGSGTAVRAAVAHDHCLAFALERRDRRGADVATTGRVLDLSESSTGWQVQVAGIQRANLLTSGHHGGILMGKFRYAGDDEETVPPLLVEEAWAQASELWAMVSDHGSYARLPQQPAVLSYWIAAHIPLNAMIQQELLEIPTTRGRLAKEISLMRTLLDGLRAQHSS